jgi:hypothetical protein
MDAALTPLHIGHATNEAEALLMLAGFAVSVLALAIAGISLWPRSGVSQRQESAIRAHRQERRVNKGSSKAGADSEVSASRMRDQ